MQKLPVVHQPEGQFECHKCGGCCRTGSGVTLEPGERERIEKHDWTQEGGRFLRSFLAPRIDPKDPERLRVQDGACVFLNRDNTCLVHSRLGATAKPLTCGVFPFKAARSPEGLRVAASAECESLHLSFDAARPLDEIPDLDDVIQKAPRLVIIGKAFVFRVGAPARVGARLDTVAA